MKFNNKLEFTQYLTPTGKPFLWVSNVPNSAVIKLPSSKHLIEIEYIPPQFQIYGGKK